MGAESSVDRSSDRSISNTDRVAIHHQEGLERMRKCDKRFLQLCIPGLCFSMLPTFILIVMKLARVINCSWTWVLAPIWIPAVVALLMFIVILSIFERRYK